VNVLNVRLPEGRSANASSRLHQEGDAARAAGYLMVTLIYRIVIPISILRRLEGRAFLAPERARNAEFSCSLIKGGGARA
jgi:hypothetical protein